MGAESSGKTAFCCSGSVSPPDGLRCRHSIYSYLAFFYSAVRGTRSNHCHFLQRPNLCKEIFFLYFNGGKEPIKLRPAEVERPNGQNTHLATPFNFCTRVPRKTKREKLLSAAPGLRGSLPFSKSRSHVALSPLLISSPFWGARGEEERGEKGARTMILASNGRVMAHPRKTDKMG